VASARPFVRNEVSKAEATKLFAPRLDGHGRYVRDLLINGIPSTDQIDTYKHPRGVWMPSVDPDGVNHYEAFYIADSLTKLTSDYYDSEVEAGNIVEYTLPDIWKDAGGGLLTEWVSPPSGYS